MNFFIEDLQVIFPYPKVFKEQYEYMKEIKHSLDMNVPKKRNFLLNLSKGHAIIEMPTGTGKTVSILSVITAYISQYPDRYSKLIYCTRTVVEMEKTLKEFQFIMNARVKLGIKETHPIFAVGLSARRNLCIHPYVSTLKEREKVDAECRKRTAEWVRMENTQVMDIEDLNGYAESNNDKLCDFHENFQKNSEKLILDRGIFTLEDLRKFGKQSGMCPYFLARKMINSANFIVYNYMYLLDPKINDMVTKEMKKDCVVIFDEAHNIDDVCIEALTVKINRNIIEHSAKNLEKLKEKIDHIKQKDISELEREYRKLEEGLSKKGIMNNHTSSNLPAEMLNLAIPGNLRKNDHFLNFLKKIVIFLRNMLKCEQFRKFSPSVFILELNNSTHIDAQSLKFTMDRFKLLLNDLHIAETDEFISLWTVALFSTLVATPFQNQFSLILEPNPNDGSIKDPLLNLACLDSSLAMKPIFERFKSVILTSGTMSPMEMYPKLLDFQPLIMKSIDISLSRNSINPMVVSKGSDQSVLSSEFAERNNKNVFRNYGMLLVELCEIVPDGIVCFFPSYKYMEEVIVQWNEIKILDQVSEYKLLFIESKDVAQTSISLTHFRRACDCGRGAVFLSIARGKVAEGIDFEGHYGRCVVMFGVPFQYTKSRILLARLEYLTKEKGIKESDFLIFDAMRQCAQCVGRVIRGKTDYGLMIFADKRYTKADKREKLPNWIKNQFASNHLNMSIDMATYEGREYFKQMAQPFTIEREKYYTNEELNQGRLEIEKNNNLT